MHIKDICGRAEDSGQQGGPGQGSDWHGLTKGGHWPLAKNDLNLSCRFFVGLAPGGGGEPTCLDLALNYVRALRLAGTLKARAISLSICKCHGEFNQKRGKTIKSGRQCRGRLTLTR